MSDKPRLLVFADAGVQTGFARVCHALCDRLMARWDIAVTGINFYGDPAPYPYPIYPAFRGGDLWGIGRYRELVDKLHPDVTLVIQDPWNVAPFVELKGDEKLVAYMPVDAEHQPAARRLNGLDLAICYTHYGCTQLRRCGYEGAMAIVPHGVDRTTFFPQDRVAARMALGMRQEDAEELLIIGAVNRNQPRKRLDLTLYAFAALHARWHGQRLKLLMHADPKEPIGYDLIALAQWLGIDEDVRFACAAREDGTSRIQPHIPDDHLALLYNAMDMQVTTSIGEGWGLTVHEGMACGVPQILPEHSALAEWAHRVALFVPAPHPVATHQIHTIGRAVDHRDVADAMEILALDPQECQRLRAAGLALVSEPRFSWDTIAGQFHSLLEGVCMGERPDRLIELVDLAEPLPHQPREVPA
jgi:glycosyltransferase involved in cell wall biosynthesis